MRGVTYPNEDFPALSLAALTKDIIPATVGVDADVPDP